MQHDQRLLQLALLAPLLACGARADSTRQEPSASASNACGDGVFPDSIEIRDQGMLEQLRGCERISGSLALHTFPGIDETPLHSLRAVEGGISVYGGGTPPVPDPIAGFRALEQAAYLSLRELELNDLQPLARLKQIGPETPAAESTPLGGFDGGRTGVLEIFSCSGLTSLNGLGALESVQGIVLRDDPDLTSLAGLENLRSVSGLLAGNSPLLDLDRIAERGLETLELDFAALTRLNGLGSASTLKTLRLAGNGALTSLSGGQVPAQMEAILISNNPSLIDLKGLEGLRGSHSITIESNPVLESLSGLDGLVEVNELLVQELAQLRDLSGIGALQSAESFTLRSTPALQSLNGLGSARISDLTLVDIPRLDLSGLESSTISHNLGFSRIEQLSAPSGLPRIEQSVPGVQPPTAFPASLSITDSPLLTDLQALAPLTALSSLTLETTAVQNLDALSNLRELTELYLQDNSALQQIDALSDVSGLETLSIRNNPALLRLPVFPNTACDTCADFGLELVNNASLQTGPGLPLVGHARSVVVSGNPALTSLSGISPLRFVGSIRVEDNPNLIALSLPQLQQAEQLVIHGNRALDDAPLAPLRQLPDTSAKIVSNLSGPALLSPCPWTLDNVCDETAGDCAPGTDTVDCGPALPGYF